MLSQFNCDVVQVLDCCCAVEAITGVEIETLAAAVDTAGSKIRTSFTSALLWTLRRDIKGSRGSTRTFAEMYAHIMRNNSTFGLEAHLIHVIGSKPSVAIRRLAGAGLPSSVTGDEQNKPGILRATITAHLNTKITPQNINEITTWFTTSVPTNVRRIDIQFEGVFESESYVVMFTVPIEVWTCLRSDLGYRMTGLTKGGNKLLQRSSQVLDAKAAPKGGENVRPEFSKN
jgi:hypothetical protein